MTYVHSKAHLLSTVVGLATATIAGINTAGSAFVVAVACALAVGVGIRVRHAATTAVLLAAVAAMLSNAPPLQAGLVGLCGAYYLLLRHAEPRSVGSTGRSPMVAAVCFTVVAVLIASLPLDFPWLTILAGPSMFVAYIVAVRPFFPRAVARSNRDEI
ncbi:hypothetical protein [Mycolicibacterium sphagni]|uniref:Integral membrane protein n=1 Tax=Mycolicibacterium sphagni TaxID=1786 RepID=A0A255D806_9MYCO|nr:hypothetical protein [Mycolicibacterium sphagni]MCV7177007.1 hypothetical protein [Mycolicibacterium sphagni]OYN75508.1 hypothetical protein CG716_25165 [Mycolicibacterium sphagni]